MKKKDSGWKLILIAKSPEGREVIKNMLSDNSSSGSRVFPLVLTLWSRGGRSNSEAEEAIFHISEGPDVVCSKETMTRIKFLDL